MSKILYTAMITIEGELNTFGTRPFATRTECVDALCMMYREDLLDDEFLNSENAEENAEQEVLRLAKHLQNNDLFEYNTKEYAITELYIEDEDFKKAEIHENVPV